MTTARQRKATFSETQFDVRTDGRARDCDGLLNFKATRETIGYRALTELIGGLVMGNATVTVTRDGGETWVCGHTKTDEGYHQEEIWYCEESSYDDSEDESEKEGEKP